MAKSQPQATQARRMESISIHKAALLDMVHCFGKAREVLDRRLARQSHSEYGEAKDEVRSALEPLLSVADAIYSYTGGDVNRKDESTVRIEYINKHGACQTLVGLLLDCLTLHQRLSQSAFPGVYYLSQFLARLVVILRNLGREESGNVAIFQSGVCSRILGVLGCGNFRSYYHLTCLKCSSTFVSASMGLIWSQCHRRQQCGSYINEAGGLGSLLRLIADQLRLFRSDPSVLRFGVGLCNSVLAASDASHAPLSEQLVQGCQRILSDSLVRVRNDGASISQLNGLCADLLELLLLLAQKLLALEPQALSVRQTCADTAITFLEAFTDSRPKSSSVALTMLEQLTWEGRERTQLPSHARRILTSFVDSCGDQTRKQRAVALLAKLVQHLTFVERSSSRLQEVALEAIPAAALVFQMDPQCSRLLVGGVDGSLTMFSLGIEKNDHRIAWCYSGNDPVLEGATSICFRPDGRRCAVGTVKGNVAILDTETGKVLFSMHVALGYQRVWFVDFADSTTLLFGQHEHCFALDVTASNPPVRLLACDRLASLSRGGQSVFMSGKHESVAMTEGDNPEQFKTRITVFQVKKPILEATTSRSPFTFSVELDVSDAFPTETAPIVHAFGLSSRYAVLGDMRSGRVALMHATKQVVLADFDPRLLFPSVGARLDIESILVSSSGSRLLLLAEAENNSTHLCCVDPITKSVLFSRALPKRVRCCALSADGSQAFIQLDADDARVIRIDMFRGDRYRLLALCGIESEVATPDILRRVKRFLIG